MTGALLGLIRIGIDPVIHLGRLSVHWYGVMYVIAFWAGWRFAVAPHLRRRGVPEATVDQLLAWAIVGGLIGARLYWVVQSTDQIHSAVDVIAVWNGGMAFFGAVIAELAVVIPLLCWRKGLSYWLVADAGVLFAVVGQPIGRIGNIINGDILGDPSTLPWATAYTHVTGGSTFAPRCAVLQPGFECGVGYQPAAAYEALAAILIGAALFGLRHRRVREGVLAITYVMLYAVSQIIVFHWRASEPDVILGLKQAQWTAIGVLSVGVPLMVLLYYRFAPQPAGTDEPGAAQPLEPVGGPPEGATV